MLGVYIHIPFCNNICSYCDFCKINYDKKYVSNYLDSLEKEIKSRYKNELIDTIYVGGGTPSSLDIDELNKLFEIIRIFNLKKNYEFTIEANIENITKDKILLFKNNKINRISLGVQSFNENNLKILKRRHTKKEVAEKIELIKSCDINNINIDLIYGVTTDIEIVKKDIDYFLDLNIPHLSSYSLIIEKNTILGNNNYQYIDEDIDYEMYLAIENKLITNNYNHYEISNYARLGYESKHNLNYWHNGYYYGFGLGSVSYLDNKRMNNTSNLSKYLNNNYIDNIIYEDKKVQEETDLMLNLRTFKGLNINEFYNKYKESIYDVFNISDMLKENKIIIENNCLKINKKYMYISNEIIINLLKDNK